jgi:hypothetical protein
MHFYFVIFGSHPPPNPSWDHAWLFYGILMGLGLSLLVLILAGLALYLFQRVIKLVVEPPHIFVGEYEAAHRATKKTDHGG